MKVFLDYLNENMYAEIVKSGQTAPSKNRTDRGCGIAFRTVRDDLRDDGGIQAAHADRLLEQSRRNRRDVAVQRLRAEKNIGTIFLGYLQGQLKDLGDRSRS